METINIHEAKTQLSRLVEMAARGESFVIAKAGKPMVRVSALDAPANEQRQRIGFLQGRIPPCRSAGCNRVRPRARSALVKAVAREGPPGPVAGAFRDREHRKRTRLYGEDARPSETPWTRGMATPQ